MKCYCGCGKQVDYLLNVKNTKFMVCEDCLNLIKKYEKQIKDIEKQQKK